MALNENYNDKNIFFLNEFKKHFPTPENLKITLTYGYFWKFAKDCERREIMKNFYMEKINCGCDVNIFTRDKDLKKYFLGNKSSTVPIIKYLPFRMDVHFTVIEPVNKMEMDKMLVLLELPHTENTLRRLEPYFTIGQLKEWGCSDESIKKLFCYLKRQRYLIPHVLFKYIPKLFNKAINWR